MNVDYVYKIASEYNKMPYTSILINGSWSIGKSYELKRAFEGKDNICYISLFGLPDNKCVYHELLMSLVASNNKRKKIFKGTKKAFTGLLTFLGKEKMLEIITEKEMVEARLNLQRNNDLIVIFDDLERVHSSFNFGEFFGVIEELKSTRKVKIILVACLDEMKSDNKQIFDEYNEKILIKYILSMNCHLILIGPA